MSENNSLTDKLILVTGASSGIGKATAIECARHGANLIITGRNVNRIEETADVIAELTSKRPLCIVGDLNEISLHDVILESFPKSQLHGVALCAGTVNVVPVAYVDESKLKATFQTNFLANVNIIRNLLKKKLLKRGSSVVAVTSVLGIDGFMAGNAAYGVSKAALESWIKYCALEYAPKGIRFNTVHPGSTDTPMIDLSSITKEQLDMQLAKIPLKRIGQPQEIAAPIVFLLSNASSFITGTSLVADGGQHLIF